MWKNWGVMVLPTEERSMHSESARTSFQPRFSLSCTVIMKAKVWRAVRKPTVMVVGSLCRVREWIWEAEGLPPAAEDEEDIVDERRLWMDGVGMSVTVETQSIRQAEAERRRELLWSELKWGRCIYLDVELWDGMDEVHVQKGMRRTCFVRVVVVVEVGNGTPWTINDISIGRNTVFEAEERGRSKEKNAKFIELKNKMFNIQRCRYYRLKACIDAVCYRVVSERARSVGAMKLHVAHDMDYHRCCNFSEMTSDNVIVIKWFATESK